MSSKSIAIVGMQCRLPGAHNIEEYWDLLLRGTDAITEVPADRWSLSDFYDPKVAAPAKMSTRWGGFIEGVDLFDPAFFGIAPREAIQMEPQQRLLLEVVWEALERAAIAPGTLAGSATGVFVGISSFDYYERIQEDAELICGYTMTGNAYSITANRISYVLDLCGPSMAIDTACSSSLVAVHQACQSLRSGESELAIAAGVHIMLSPWVSVACTKGEMMSPDGRCKTFDARANGYVRSEGVGAVVLKPLDRAVADRDPICAVIRGSAVNQDGRSNGLTAPNPKSQRAVIRAACRDAGVQAAEIGYVEAHGTGTRVGDPIEIEALGAVLHEGRSAGSRCWVGSAKTNIGHTEAVSGIAGLIKAALVVKHGMVPKHLHFQQPNPLINFAALPLAVPTDTVPWTGEAIRVAGVNSFGFGGTNSHVILQQPPEPPAGAEPTSRVQLLLLSAKTPNALQQAAAAYVQTASGLQSQAEVADLCYTSTFGREHFTHRLAATVESADELRASLQTFLQGKSVPNLVVGRRARRDSQRLAFIFTGQGSQYPGMGQEAYANNDVFRHTLNRCDEYLRPLVGLSLIEELYVGTGSSERFFSTAFAQPALFAIEAALADLLKSWNVFPAAVLGHSLGEFTACYAAGVFSLEDGLQLVAERGRLMQSLSGAGAMAAVFTTHATVESFIARYEDIQIAAINGIEHIVITGPAGSVTSAVQSLRTAGVQVSVLPVKHGFHSRLMEPVVDGFADVLRRINFQPPAIPVVSNLTGGVIAAAEICSPEYWCRHMQAPVRFVEGVEALATREIDACIEIGPKPVLSALGRRLATQMDFIPTLRGDGADWRSLLGVTAELHCRGETLAWSKVLQDPSRRARPAPNYPFQRRRYWISDELISGVSVLGYHAAHKFRHPLLGNARQISKTDGGRAFRVALDPTQLTYLSEHRVAGTAVLPATAYLEMVQGVAAEIWPNQNWHIRDVEFYAPLVVSGATAFFTLELGQLEEGRFEFRFAEPAAGGRGEQITYASGTAFSSTDEPGERRSGRDDIEAIQGRCSESVDAEELYAGLEADGFAYGRSFRGVERIWRGVGEALGRITVSGELEQLSSYINHPCILDACLHAISGTIAHRQDLRGGRSYITFIRSVRYFRPLASMQVLWSHAVLARESLGLSGGIIEGDVSILDAQGAPLAELHGLCLQYLPESADSAEEKDEAAWPHVLSWIPAETVAARGDRTHTDGYDLVFMDDSGFGETLCAVLVSQGRRCIVVRPGTGYRAESSSDFRIDFDSNEDVQRLFREVTTTGSLDRLFVLTPLYGSYRSDIDAGCTPELVSRVSRSVFHVAQALARLPEQLLPEVHVVTTHTQSVLDEAEVANVHAAPVWGIVRSLRYEVPGIRCRLIDLDGLSAVNAHALADSTLMTLEEEEIALRDGNWFLARLVPVDKPTEVTSGLRPLRADRCYLITGGLGALGLYVAEALVECGARYLVLFGRSEPSSQATQRLARLQRSGGVIAVCRGDVADGQELGRALSAVPVPLGGVIHAAGVLSDGALTQMTWERFAAVLLPKVTGTLNLHKLTTGLELEFFVLFSSVAALLGSPGQANYAAANAFMDAIAAARVGKGHAALSINWGAFADAGMAATVSEPHQARMNERGIRPIDPGAGAKLLSQIVGTASGVVALLSIDWHAFIRSLGNTRPVPRVLELLAPGLGSGVGSGAQATEGLMDKLRISNAADGAGIVADFVRRLAQRILRTNEVDLPEDQSLNSLGLDSIMTIEFNRGVKVETGVEVPIEKYFSGLSIIDVTRLVYDQMSSALGATDLQIARTT